jgi:hypothetical protein
MSKIWRLLLFGLLFAGAASAAEQTWSQIRMGMTTGQTASLLGEPMFRRRGHGFETWTYEGSAEVVFYGNGAVVAWTAPAEPPAPPRSRDLWSSLPKGKYVTMHAALRDSPGSDPAPTGSAAARKRLRPDLSDGYEAYLRG